MLLMLAVPILFAQASRSGRMARWDQHHQRIQNTAGLILAGVFAAPALVGWSWLAYELWHDPEQLSGRNLRDLFGFASLMGVGAVALYRRWRGGRRRG